jgi:hypothetical protein
MIRQRRRLHAHNLEVDRQWAAQIIAAGKMSYAGGVPEIYTPLVIVPALPWMLTLMCIQFLPVINVMNVSLVSISLLITGWTVFEVIRAKVQGSQLMAIRTGLPAVANYRLTVDALQALRYRIKRGNQFLVTAHSITEDSSVPTETIFTFFVDGVVYCYVRTMENPQNFSEYRYRESLVFSTRYRTLRHLRQAILRRLPAQPINGTTRLKP